MKKVILIAIAVIITICVSHSCCFGVEIDPDWEEKYLINFDNTTSWQISDNGTELDVKLEFFSDFTDDACLILYVTKEIVKDELYLYEGFKDSLEIDNFYVRSYAITVYDPSNHSSISNYDKIMNGLISPDDFPVYVKNIFINAGKNHESFKIVFPESIFSISGNVFVDIGIFKFDNEIKSLFKYPHGATSDYFKVFPDSSNTSYIFSDPVLIQYLTRVHGREHISDRCIDFKNVTYYNHKFRRLNIKY